MAGRPIHSSAAATHVPGGARPLWAQATEAAGAVFCAGTVGVRPDGTLPEGLAEQTRQALDNLEATLAAAGLAFGDIAKVRVFVERPEDYLVLNEVRIPYYRERFPAGDYPASTVLVTGLLDDQLRVEIEAFAHPRKRMVDAPEIVKRIPLDLPAQPLWRLGGVMGDLLFTTGQPGLDLEARLVGPDAASQARQSLRNVASIVEAAGYSPGEIARLDTYIADPADHAAVVEARNEALARWFPAGDYPASTTVVAGMPPPGMIVEIEAIAARGPRSVFGTARAGELGSRAVRAGDWVFASGRGVQGAMPGQAEAALVSVAAALAEAGAAFSQIVQVTVWLRDAGLYGSLNEVRWPFYRRHFDEGAFPASTAVVGPSPEAGTLLELEVIAHTG